MKTHQSFPLKFSQIFPYFLPYFEFNRFQIRAILKLELLFLLIVEYYFLNVTYIYV